jgi:hypothetical protein
LQAGQFNMIGAPIVFGVLALAILFLIRKQNYNEKEKSVSQHRDIELTSVILLFSACCLTA